MQKGSLERPETLFEVQLIVCIQLRCAAEQLHCNIRNVRKTKKKDVGNNNSTEVTRLKRDAAVAGEL